MIKFKRGDLVRIIKTCPECVFRGDCEFLEGLNSVGKISHIEGNKWIVEKLYGGRIHRCHFKPEQLELVNKPAKKIIKPYPIVAFLNGDIK